MKRKLICLLLTALLAAGCAPFISGCGASMDYTLKTAEDGEKYYILNASGFKTSIKGALEIPAYYGEGEERFPVKEIAREAFSNCNIISVKIPATVTTIGLAAFAYCDNLRSVTFEEGTEIEEIPQGAFGFCNMLTEFTVPESVKSVGMMAFYSCAALEKIVLPEGLETISPRAFAGCSVLKDVTLPQTLITVGDESFNATAIEEITIPASVHDYEKTVTDEDGNITTLTVPGIGYAAFHSCESLKVVKIEADIEEIKAGTFGYCPKLETIYLPASLLKVGGTFSVVAGTVYYWHAFHNDEGLANVYFAGSASAWEKVEIDKTSVTESGITYNNNALLNATKHFAED